MPKMVRSVDLLRGNPESAIAKTSRPSNIKINTARTTTSRNNYEEKC